MRRVLIAPNAKRGRPFRFNAVRAAWAFGVLERPISNLSEVSFQHHRPLTPRFERPHCGLLCLFLLVLVMLVVILIFVGFSLFTSTRSHKRPSFLSAVSTRHAADEKHTPTQHISTQHTPTQHTPCQSTRTSPRWRVSPISPPSTVFLVECGDAFT